MSDRYYGLISSLPYLGTGEGRDFQAVRVPISRENLKARLHTLSSNDYEQIKAIINFQQGLYAITSLTDQQVCELILKTLEKLKDSSVIKLFTSTLEVWLIMESLHQRQLGRNDTLLPSLPLAAHIRRNWSHPDFLLTGRFSWIPTARKMMTQNHILALERYIDQIRWQIANQASIQDPFSFVAVVAYAGKWEILYRWHQVEQTFGQQRFDELVESVLSGV